MILPVEFSDKSISLLSGFLKKSQRCQKAKKRLFSQNVVEKKNGFNNDQKRHIINIFI